jgi:hypothetical protein
MSPVDAAEDNAAAREARRNLRRAYGCDCNGDADPSARADNDHAHIARSVSEQIHEHTETRCIGCPWQALRDPYVQRVFEAYEWAEKGELAFYAPDAGSRVVRGVTWLRTVLGKIDAVQREHERKKRQQESTR